MKSFSLMLWITIVFLQFAYGQSSTSPIQAQPPSVKVKLTGFDPATDADLTVKFVLVELTPDHQATTTLNPDNNGQLVFTLPFALPYQQIWFSVGEYYYGELIVNKGLDIDIQLPALKVAESKYASRSVDYNGPDGAMTQYVNEYVVFVSKLRDEGNYPDIFELMRDRTMPLEEKVEAMWAINKTQAEFEQQFVAEHPSPHSWILENERISDFYGNLCVVHWGKEMPEELFKEILRHEPKLISNDGSSSYYGYLQNFLIIPTQEEHIGIYEEELMPNIIPEEQERLQNFLVQWRKKLAEESYDQELFKTDSRYFYRQYDALFFTGRVKNFLRKATALPPKKADMVKMLGGDREVWKNEEYQRLVLPTMHNEYLKHIMEERWAETRKQLDFINEQLQAMSVEPTDAPVGKNLGTLPSGATLFEAETDDLDAFLGAIRSTSSGKAMILDIWATWCSPCIHDMKKSADQRKALEEMGVEVVYLCTTSGTNLEGWKNMVTQLGIDTRHIYMTKAVSEEIMKRFNLPGYPSHIFIDSKGKYHPGVVHGLQMLDLEEIKEKM
ncbi:MAG: TlpA disulfide reductase family protein [Saprospiraceae bacterium]|nr:TlpA family protein disulfide reductase [Lewinella sp.]